MDKVRVAVVGLGFGAEFVPVYQAWKQTECAAICRRDAKKLNAFADRFGIAKRYTSYAELLKDPDIDAVHINSDLYSHGWMAILALKAGKHVASTVPMAMDEKECEEIVRLEKETGKVYMMMETSIYTREFLYLMDQYKKGALGRLQFLRASHQQNMSMPGWPPYWYGMPPMYYATHVVAPISALIGKPVECLQCVGSGCIEQAYVGVHQSSFAAESAHLKFRESDVCGEATRTLFATIRQYRESFDVYASNRSFEWAQCANGEPVLFSGFEDAQTLVVPDTSVLLPDAIAPFALKDHTVDADSLSFIQGSDHGGSHPHLVYEFISAILENRLARVHAKIAANWTVCGLRAHESAMREGELIKLPEWTMY